MNPIAQNISDTALAAAAVSSPWWIEHMQTGIGLYMALGGAFLLTLRVLIAWKQWRKK